MKRIATLSFFVLLSTGCVVVGGYSDERGWFLWPGTIVIFLVIAVLILFVKRRK